MGLYNAPAAYRELGGILRRLRKDAGLSGSELARRMGVPGITISRMELGKRDSTTVEVVQYAVTCGLTFLEAKPLLELTWIAERRQGYWLSDKQIGGSLQSLIFHESSVDRPIDYEPQRIPGLLQTPDYTRAVVFANDPDLPEHDVAGATRTRQERQRILHRENPAPHTFYVHEHALRLRVGGNAIMRDQLLHLVLMTALDHITVRVVPSAEGERSVFGGPFKLLEFADHVPLVYRDLPGGGLFIDDPTHVQNHYRLLPRLTDVALDEWQSRQLIADLADEYDRGSPLDPTHYEAKERLKQSPSPIYETG